MKAQDDDGLDRIDARMFFSLVEGQLDERSNRVVASAFALAEGARSISHVASCAKVSRPLIYRGIAEFSAPQPGTKPNGERRLRKAGAGRPKLVSKFPGIVGKIRELIEPHVRGNPESPLLWISKSLAKIRDVLRNAGYSISVFTVRSILRELGYTLQSCKKSQEGCTSPDRDAQFRHIAACAARFQSRREPVISVDTKKKELVGNFKNAGRDYHPKGKSPEVKVHDFMEEGGRATPYGVYDIANNEGFVNVGIGPDTAEFSVESIGKWWKKRGSGLYPKATRLMITADGGGSNGSRNRLWKMKLQEFANETGLSVTVTHYPPGTSKWNKIEHRMFSFISTNWRGKPLSSLEVIVSLIAATTNSKGLKILAELSSSRYETGVSVSDGELEGIRIRRHKFHPEWNYTIMPVR